MMLRASTSPAVTDGHGALIDELVAAAVGDDPGRADAARSSIIDQLGADWMIDACAVIANFEMMTRLADATGARLRPGQIEAAAPIRAQLGLDAFASARR